MFQSGGGHRIELSAAAKERGRAWMDTLEDGATTHDAFHCGCSVSTGGFETAHSAVSASAVACGASGAAPPPIRPLHKPGGPGGFKRPRPKCSGPDAPAAAEANSSVLNVCGPIQSPAGTTAREVGSTGPTSRPIPGGMCSVPSPVRTPLASRAPRLSHSDVAPMPGASGGNGAAERLPSHVTPVGPRVPLAAASAQRSGFRPPRKAPAPPPRVSPALPVAVHTPARPVYGRPAPQQRPAPSSRPAAPTEARSRCSCLTVAPLSARPCPSCCPACGGCLEDPSSVQVMHTPGCRNDGAGLLRAHSESRSGGPPRQPATIRGCVG